MGYMYEDLVSNESINAVMSGLNFSKRDSVVSICGSGDYAFAMLEKVRDIVVVDNRETQIDLFDYRKKLIEEGDFKKFLKIKQEPVDRQDERNLEFRNRYFSYKRLKKIRKNLESAIVTEWVGDIFNMKLNKEANKVFLSNVLSYWKYRGNRRKDMQIITNWVSVGGLIYVSDGRISDELLNPQIEVDKYLTKESRKIQREEYNGYNWSPVVFRKVK
jgi:hypothetical protein